MFKSLLFFHIYVFDDDVATIGQQSCALHYELSFRLRGVVGEAPRQFAWWIYAYRIYCSREGVSAIEQVCGIGFPAVALGGFVFEAHAHHAHFVYESQVGGVVFVVQPVGANHADGVGCVVYIFYHLGAGLGSGDIGVVYRFSKTTLKSPSLEFL